ncbi:YdiU family protein [Pricia sp. S334]|uniref:Protein nucleotidyltransferase YdiU n=1 Tax=Pricia mediterranea TaxID=3076079 RepID=A0ABU3L546_9FLAO|nr:YdiU family protein [Pricia sp. S334]MDT7828839.1 YdiU family protein [Pricia sp. S334]
MISNLNVQDRFNKELPADPTTENGRRKVMEACFSYVKPKATANPRMLHVSPEMLDELGLTATDAQSEAFVQVLSGNEIQPGTNPYAMCYGGHQFGNWAGQLGDGRAINLAEVEHEGKHWVLQLKGAGETPYSRTADGLAVLRSSIREYLCSEAMYHLEVPTTRALSLALTGDQVLRDALYDGNPEYEKGAIVCRVAPSFLRFGSYEIFAARRDAKTLRTLVDYTIKHHFPHLGEPSKETYLQFFKEVGQKSIDMVMHWQRVGFVHGVMNTDNMSILGQTIDYGPYGWLEGYDHGWTPNTTDFAQKRYRYGTQLQVALWNLNQLANALYPLIGQTEALEAALKELSDGLEPARLDMMKSKLGLFEADKNDAQLVEALETVLQRSETDMTIFFRNLADFKKDGTANGLSLIANAFYRPDEITGALEEEWKAWFMKYEDRLEQETKNEGERKAAMNGVNPKYVLRNYMAQLAIDAADNGDYSVLDELFDLLKLPYAEQPDNEKWFDKRPEWAKHKIGCSMLSCSS